MIRRFVLLGEVVLTLGLCGTAWGAQSLYPYPCTTPCTPNTVGFGYFPTRWRQWPGEERLPQVNPKAVGAEVLPTPEGQEQVAPPVATPGQGPSAAPGGEILPPSGAILPPQEPPAEPKPEKPSKEGGLPGLPPESGPKPESKPKTQPPSTKGGTLSEATEQVPAGIEPAGTNQVTTAFGSSDERQVQPGTVISLVDPQNPRSGHMVLSAHRADSIGIAEPTSSAHEIEAAAYATVESAAPTAAGDAKAAPPSIALGGYCPVELVRNGRWTLGDLRWTVVHDGWIYRLSGPAQRREFQANPEAFTPAYSGNDPVLTVDEHRTVPGQLKYCATYNGRLYVFAGAATQLQFDKQPQRYVVKR